MSTFIQIGTNNGKDEFNELVRVTRPSKIILIEPNKACNASIRESYKDVSNVFLENIAITTSQGYHKLYHPRNFNGKARNGVCYSDAHFSLVPMKDWGEELDTIEVPGMTFNDLCSIYKVDYIDYLQIDTEGYDAKIIKSIDFDKITIKTIRYEYWGFDKDCYKEGVYGKEEMEEVWNYLSNLGYQLTPINNDIIAIKR